MDVRDKSSPSTASIACSICLCYIRFRCFGDYIIFQGPRSGGRSSSVVRVTHIDRDCVEVHEVHCYRAGPSSHAYSYKCCYPRRTHLPGSISERKMRLSSSLACIESLTKILCTIIDSSFKGYNDSEKCVWKVMLYPVTLISLVT